MSNGSNIFGLNAYFYSGTKGDISSVSGSLVVSGAIGQSRATYVDADYVNLRKRGLLAYPNLQLAMNSWDTGGEAFVKFGAPTVTGYGNVLVGPGTYEICSGAAVGNDSSIDFLNIKGASKEQTILTNTVRATAGVVLRFNTNNINISDLTFRGTSIANGLVTMSECDGEVSRVRFDGNATQQLLNVGDFLLGKFIDCTFDGSLVGATNTNPFTFATFRGILQTCNFTSSGENNSLLKIQGNFANGQILDCRFTANIVDTAAISIGAQTTENMTIDGCVVFVRTSGICFEDNFLQYIGSVDDSKFAGPNTAISLIGHPRSVWNNCYLFSFDNDSSAVLLNSSSTGFTAQGCRIIGQGTGLAVLSDGTFNTQITHSVLRKPTSNIAGSSVSSTLGNNADTPYNTEVNANVIS